MAMPTAAAEPTTTAGPTRWSTLGAVALTAAGPLHLMAAVSFLGVDLRFFAFFIVVGATQAFAGPRLRRGTSPPRDVVLMAMTVALLLLYLYTPGAGLPGGLPAAGLLATGAAGCELLAVAGMQATLPPRWRSRTGRALTVVGACVWVLWLTGTHIGS